MGAKSPAKLKLRRPMFKCNICQRKLLSSQALKTHQYSVHKIESPNSPSRAPARTAVKTKFVPKKVQAAVSKVTNPKNKPQTSVQASDNSDDEARVLAPEKVSDLRKIQFECPKCNVMFPAYFPAYKHIQKYHCVNSKGQKVHAASPDLITPLRVEMCIKCNKRVRANDLHVCCETRMLDDSGIGVDYMCMGCKQKFSSMQLFDLHVSGLHSDGVESLFFPSMSEFLAWKTQMQSKTKTTYLILGKCNLKQTYRCTYLPPSDTTSSPNNTSNICPASIVVQEFSKGIQVHFYKIHHGHKCPDYVCPEKYKKYLITSLMQEKNPESYDVVYNEKDMYCQFKVLLESIIVEAAKVKVDDLKLMLEKALEMTTILNNYDEDDDTYTITNKKSLCEGRIAKALDNLKGFAIKRKANNENSDSIDQKKKKETEITPKIVNSFSMATKSNKVKEDPVKKQDPTTKQDVKNVDANVTSPRVLRNTQIQSPSFNDSYKDFVDKNFKPAVDNVPPAGLGRSRLIIKSQSLSQSKSESTTPPVDKEKGLRVRPLSKLVDPKEIEDELAKDFIEVPVPKAIKNVNFEPKDVEGEKLNCSEATINKVSPKENKGPNIDTKSPESETDKDTKDPVVNKQFTPKFKPKKQVMKTKIGQFKPNFSPKSSLSPETSEGNLNRSIGRIKPDIKYEVMEQENDCNILILKI